MTGAFPFIVFGSFFGAALVYYYSSDAEAAGPDLDSGEPPPKKPVNKLPTPKEDPPPPEEEPIVFPPNMFMVTSLATEDAVSSFALQQSLQHEGVVLVIYRPAAAEMMPPELVIAATSYPDVTFLAYPENISQQLKATAVVPHSCGPNDIVSAQPFPTVLTQQGATWGEETPTCVASVNALELRAALATAAESVI